MNTLRIRIVMLLSLAVAPVLTGCDKFSQQPIPSSGARAAENVGGGAPEPLSPAPIPVSAQEETRQAHEDAARIALASVKALLSAQDYDNAARLAANASKDYADTQVAADFAPLGQQAERALSAAAQARAQAAVPGNDSAARHARFLDARDAGLAAMDRQDFNTAVAQFQKALQEENDPETRAALQHVSLFVGKPRIAIAEFEVVGDVGIQDAGKVVPELMLGRFDAGRFQLVERDSLDALLTQQGYSMNQVAQMPTLLRVRRGDSVRYLVVGTVSRLGPLTVSARLIDVFTGEVVQTADATANDPADLRNSLAELTAILQMSNEEKANYLAFRQRQTDAMAAVDPAAMAEAQAQRQAALEAQRQQMAREQAASFQAAMHERDAAVALADIKTFFSQSDYVNALRYIRWAVPRYADTSAARELAAMDAYAQARYQEQLVQQRNAAEWARIQAEQAARHQRFVQFREQGMAALAANDLLTSMNFLQSALNEEDNSDVRGILDYVVRRMERPGIVVLDFDVRGDIGMPPRDAPRWLASFLLRQFGGEASPYRLVQRDEFIADLRRVGLTLDDVQRDPLQPRMRLLRNQVRYIILGTASHGSINLSTAMIDLAAGRNVQTAEFIAEDVRALPDALAQTAAVLQMSDDQKHVYIDQLQYANWLARGDAAAAALQWDAALDAYGRAYRISNTPDSLDRLTTATRQIEDFRRARRAYDTAMAAASDAGRRGNWEDSLNLYRQAIAIMDTPEARAAAGNARRQVIAAVRDRRAFYNTTMASGDTFTRNGDPDRALDAYQQAYEIDPTPEAGAAVSQAQKTIADRQQAKRRSYASAMGEAKSAIQAGNWTRALDAFTRAAAIDDTREASTGIATARTKLAESDANNKLYDAAMQEGRAAVQSGDWQKALAAHTRALHAINKPEVQTAIELDKKRIAEIQQRDQKALYDTAMASAATRSSAGQWQEALDAYRSAYQVQKTKEAAAGISQATKMLSDAQYNKKQYDKAMADAASSVQANAWQKALNAYQQAVAIDATVEAKAGVENAKKHIADGLAAEKNRQYTQFMTEGDAAGRANDWKKALGAYTKAVAVDNTPAAQAALVGAQKKITEADAATAAAADRKKQYTQYLSQGEAAARANDWPKAVDAYTKAAAIDNTPAAQAGIANAQKKIADASAATAAAADRKQQYDRLMADGATAARAGEWQKALDAFTKAAAIDNTAQVKTEIAAARKQIADAANAAAAADAKKKEYARLMTDGDSAARASAWQRAIDAYTKAAAIDNTAAAQAGIASARGKLAEASAGAAAAAEKKKQYDAAMAQGDAAAKTRDWQKALDAYNRAAAIDNTRDAVASIANAKKNLADAATAAEKKTQYAALMADAKTAEGTEEWQRALDTYNKAAAIDNTNEVKTAIANVKKKIAALAATASAVEAKKKEFARLMTDGDNAAKASAWQKALDAYSKAAAIDNTPEARAGIDSSKQKLAEMASAAADKAEKKKQYDQEIKDGDAAARTNDWQKAMDFYAKAQALDNTSAVQSKFNNAKQKLYAAFMAEGAAAAKTNAWQKAVDAYTKAEGVNSTAEAKTALDNAKKKLAGGN